ncbi:DUF1572 domain-containing protein [Aureivirga sp. CE67]|uniref:DUF1572 domain-containing protein n=1 Tax=Aureivirga sp. CE67 TaxID=1788983 RepID=UPI0018CB42FB|nr:DUF1572 domain-containing protein [Aureivirga sp. CE67]
MTNSKKLADRFREVLLNGKWIANTNYQETLKDIDWKQAIKKVENLNSIAILTFHVNYYISGINYFFETGKLEISDKNSFDMIPVNSEEDWNLLKNDLIKNAEKFAVFVENLEEEKLSKPFFKKEYGDYQRNIEGMIEHAYYHLGQISLLKK